MLAQYVHSIWETLVQVIFVIVLAVVLLMAALQLYVVWRAHRSLGQMAPPLEEVLPAGTSPQRRMLFYFYSEHCGPCRSVTPLIDDLADGDEGVVKFDVRRHFAVARRFGVMGTPTLVLLLDGRIARVHVGGITPARLQRFWAERK